jgi:NAD(P)-dependent dehydrogenase (short-subunit alcohol dehydrogenase family)
LPFEFEGSVAAVTGAASGIGRASALAFAHEGADVVVSDFRDEDGMIVAKEIEELGRKALYVHADVSKIDDVNALVDSSIEWQGHCDLFMSNAGIGMSGAPHSIPQDEWDRVLAINLHSHIWAVRRVLPHMLERGSGHLVHTSSSAGTVGFASLIPYVVTKFGVAGLCESMAGFLHDRGIGVSVVCPLLVNTNIFDRSWAYPEEGTVDPMFEDGPMKDAARQLFAENGLTPEAVAEHIVTAVEENHLYVFPSPELKGMIEEKWRDPDAWVRQQSAQFRMQQEMGRQLSSQQ